MWSIRYKCGGVHCLLFSPILMMGGNSSCNKMLSVWMYADAQCLRHALQARVPHFFFKNFKISLDFLGICFQNISKIFLRFSGQILFQIFSEILQSSNLLHIGYWKIFRGWQPSPSAVGTPWTDSGAPPTVRPCSKKFVDLQKFSQERSILSDRLQPRPTIINAFF